MTSPVETITKTFVPPTETITRTYVPRPPKQHKHPKQAPFGYLTFQGIGFFTLHHRQFDVLCGDEPPTITDGYAKWQTIDRPLMRGVTVFQGYNPATMTVNVRFGAWGNIDTGGNDPTGAWLQGDRAGKLVESKISDLEWMGGSQFRAGPSPVIYVDSFSSQPGVGRTDLIPRQYAGLPWVCTGLTWGTAIRNNNGYRVWQEAAITLMNYLNFSAPPKETTEQRGGYFISRGGKDTALRIAASPSTFSPVAYHEILARRIIHDPHNKHLRLRGIKQHIKHGKKVWVPAHQI